MQQPFSIAVAVMILGAALNACGPADEAEARAHADRWAQARSQGWELTVDDRDPQRAMVFGPSSGRCPNTSGVTTVKYAAPGYDVLLGFNCLVGRPTTLATLQEAFSFAVLDELPHGIDVPGWRFEVTTPSSSFREGVTLTSLANGQLSLRIETMLASLMGTSEDRTACPLTADASLPPGCLVSRQLGIPLTLTMNVPFAQELFAP